MARYPSPTPEATGDEGSQNRQTTAAENMHNQEKREKGSIADDDFNDSNNEASVLEGAIFPR